MRESLQRQTLESQRRIDQVVLTEAIAAYHHCNVKFLESLGIDPTCAEVLGELDSTTLKCLVTEMSVPVTSVVINNELLCQSATAMDRTVGRARLLRRLIDLEATPQICGELGFAVSERFRNRIYTLNGTTRGTKRKLTDRQAVAIHRYWETVVSPEETHPIDHLIRTCEHFRVTVPAVWIYLCQSIHLMSRTRNNLAYPWIVAMFPRWSGT